MPPQQELYTVPTPMELQGNFSQSVQTNGALYVVKDPLTGAPFPNNIVPSTRIDPNMQKVLGVFPAPNFFNTAVSGRQYNYVISDSTSNPAHQELARMDYDPTAKWRFYIRGLEQFMTKPRPRRWSKLKQLGNRPTTPLAGPRRFGQRYFSRLSNSCKRLEFWLRAVG